MGIGAGVVSWAELSVTVLLPVAHPVLSLGKDTLWWTDVGWDNSATSLLIPYEPLSEARHNTLFVVTFISF